MGVREGVCMGVRAVVCMGVRACGCLYGCERVCAD